MELYSTPREMQRKTAWVAQDDDKAGVMREGSGSEWAGDSLVPRDKQEEAHSQEN